MWYFIEPYSLKSIVKSVGFRKKMKGGMAIKGRLLIEGDKPPAHYGNVFSNILGGLKIKKIIERIVEIWSSVIKIMNDWMSLPPS